jgi:acyl-CoA synthetase (AMP-forming)/AMP-acid ligase II
VPLYHDMGLIWQVMLPLFVGAHSVLMPPAAFMQRPLGWLRALSDFRAEITCAPNFAFDLCVTRFRDEQMRGVDLSPLKVALNAAEPVQADTISRFTATFAAYGFDAGAMYPAYGLAEATLLVSGEPPGRPPVTRPVGRAALQAGRIAAPESEEDAHSLVACGHSLPGGRFAIVDPDRLEEKPAGIIGEIWASGPSIAQGYWRQPDATAATFQARIAGGDGAAWLRTGDLGVLDETGALYITGRIKDLIIIRGVNHYPQDIERTVQSAHPALRLDGGVAFSHVDETGTERLVVVQEIERAHRHDLDVADVVARIRAAISLNHEIAAHEIVLIRPALLPKTTSGKVQRAQARRLWLSGALNGEPPE